MKRGLHTRGYTIVEVMIVLAVSGALLVSVMVGIGLQQRRTEFSQTINDFQAQINDVMNTVATGYAVNSSNFKCDVNPPGNGPTLTLGTNERGESQDCIILGRVMQLGVNANPAAYSTYTIVGQRQTSGLQEVTTLTDAKPKAVVTQNGGSDDSIEKATLGGGVTVTKMYFTTDGVTRQPTAALGFLSTLGQYTSCTGLCSGTTNVQLYGLKNSLLGNSANQVTDATSGITANNLTWTTTKGNVVICLKSGGTDQYGVITVGSNNRQLTTSLEVLSTSVAEGDKCQ